MRPTKSKLAKSNTSDHDEQTLDVHNNFYENLRSRPKVTKEKEIKLYKSKNSKSVEILSHDQIENETNHKFRARKMPVFK